MEASNLTSLRAASFSFWDIWASCTDLMAYYFPSASFFTRCTVPKLPEPSYLAYSKSFYDKVEVFMVGIDERKIK